MALNELHARRLATVAKMFEAALDRMELTLHSVEEGEDGGSAARISPEQASAIRDRMAAIRVLLRDGLGHFAIKVQKPEPQPMLIAELSTLWVILENARPARMKGYGREFAAQDKADWENLVQALMNETELIRRVVLKGKGKS